MKRKTQIKRKAKRMLSLLLTAMLLISTMVVGISTVSAAENTLQPTTDTVADGYYRVFVTDSKYFNSAPYIHYWGGSSATDWNKRPTMNKLSGTNAQSQNVYWYDVPSDSTGIIFQHPNQSQSVDLEVGSDTKLKFQNGAGYYISDEKDGKYVYSYWNASSLLPSTAVATSVTLSASKSEISPNETVTLTAKAEGKIDGFVNYVLKANGVALTGSDYNKSTSDSEVSFTVTPSDTTKYTVEVSAEGRTSVTSNEQTVTVTKPDVATSVSLSASSASVVEGNSVTLTAEITGKNSDTVTLTLVDDNGATIDTKTVTTDSAEFTVTPSAETTYKVVVSAEGYNSVESAAVTVSIVVPKKFYLFYSDYTKNQDNPNNWPSDNKILMTYEDGKYVGVIEGVATSNNYFAINDNDSLSADNQLWTRDTMNQIKLTNESSYISKTYGVKDYGNIVNFYYHASSSASSIKVIFDGENGVTLADAGSTPVEKVTINVPAVDNATVTATSDDTTAAEGKSLTIAKNSTFTVTVTPDDGYELASIAYNGETKTASPATFTAAVSGDITVTVNKKETPTEPSTEPTTEPTTAPTEDKWYLKGNFNKWGTTNQFTGSDDTLTTNLYIDSETVYQFKVWNTKFSEEGVDGTFYGTVDTDMGTFTEIKDLTVKYVKGGNEKRNINFRPEKSGLYKFTFNPSTLTLNAELVQSGLNVEVTAPESVKAGETFSITAKAIPDSTITPASYKFTIMIGGTVVVKEAVSTTTQYTYNKATISAPAYVSAFVEAFDADGNIIGASPTVECEHQTIVTYDDLTVQLSANGSEVVVGTEVTLTAAATPASYVSSYDFLISKSYDFKEDVGVDTKTSTSSTLKYTFDTVGTYYVKVVAHNKYGQTVNAALDATSNIIEITVVESVGEHEVTFYFKAPSTFAYFPKMTLDGTALTVTKGDELGASFTGSVTFYWYKATATVDSSSTHTLAISTRRTNASGSMTGNFYGSEYWLAIDNLMSGKTLANLTSLQPYIRNYYHSPLHTVYAGVADDGTLGFTNIDGKRYAMGSYADGDPSTANATLSIKAATAAQKSVTQSETYSEVQTCLLDVNLDGKVDIFDATMIQRALVNIQ